MRNFYLTSKGEFTNKVKPKMVRFHYDDTLSDIKHAHSHARPWMHPKLGLCFVTPFGTHYDQLDPYSFKNYKEIIKGVKLGLYIMQFDRKTDIKEQLKYAAKQEEKYGSKTGRKNEWKDGGGKSTRARSLFKKLNKQLHPSQ
jgi:hypothetical protein